MAAYRIIPSYSNYFGLSKQGASFLLSNCATNPSSFCLPRRNDLGTFINRSANLVPTYECRTQVIMLPEPVEVRVIVQLNVMEEEY